MNFYLKNEYFFSFSDAEVCTFMIFIYFDIVITTYA
jgi:hypothetical protein